MAEFVDPFALPSVRADEPEPEPGVEPEAEPARTVVWEGRSWPVLRRVSLDEETYVARELAVTRAAIAAGMRNVSHQGEDALARSERYARWRFNGFLAGQVASL